MNITALHYHKCAFPCLQAATGFNLFSTIIQNLESFSLVDNSLNSYVLFI